ncbi:hypothetical protein G1C95_1015 [Bifidobacterium sp. DSM 109957]|uniref:Uncharacterized protein n=1 Tax=Bifidobacterium oedipodis TaxID=2675322 RepID=A0A7Y0HSP8_9BIFI|nr:hypothetical protein [Bifidobacterium sp. DSM 109957]
MTAHVSFLMKPRELKNNNGVVVRLSHEKTIEYLEERIENINSRFKP